MNCTPFIGVFLSNKWGAVYLTGGSYLSCVNVHAFFIKFMLVVIVIVCIVIASIRILIITIGIVVVIVVVTS